MVGRIFMLLSWLMMPVIGFAGEAPLRLQIPSAGAEYGKPIPVELFASNTKPALDSLDLSSLQRDFVVETPDNVERDTNRQHWRIRLYARHPGELWIPSLDFQGHKTMPLKLDVGAPLDGRDRSPMRIASQVSDTRVWINQPVRVSLQLDTDQPYGRLSIDAAQRDDFEIETLTGTRATTTWNGQQRTVHRIGWLLYPQTPGRFAIQLPAVKYQRDGVVTHRFYPPEIALQVRALPSFVPPTMPVGRMQLDVSLPQPRLLLKRELAFLTLRISSQGTSSRPASVVLRQLKSTPSVTFYPPRNLPAEDDGASGSAKVTSYQVPFAARTMGLIALPSVRLQYFDPATGKIESYSQSLGRFVSISPWLLYVGMAAVLLVLYRFTRLLYRWSRRKYRVFRAYRSALFSLQQADTPQAIRAALMVMAEAEYGSGNLTLAAWLDRWLSRYPELSFVADSVLRLQAWLYGRTEATLADIRADLIHACYRRMPLLKIPLLTQQ